MTKLWNVGENEQIIELRPPAGRPLTSQSSCRSAAWDQAGLIGHQINTGAAMTPTCDVIRVNATYQQTNKQTIHLEAPPTSLTQVRGESHQSQRWYRLIWAYQCTAMFSFQRERSKRWWREFLHHPPSNEIRPGPLRAPQASTGPAVHLSPSSISSSVLSSSGAEVKRTIKEISLDTNTPLIYLVPPVGSERFWFLIELGCEPKHGAKSSQSSRFTWTFRLQTLHCEHVTDF